MTITIIMITVSIRQPGYLPYLGFFKKIQTSDIFVYLDDVQYERGDFDNRNKIRTFQGEMFLTVPVYNKFGQKLNEVKIVNTEDWGKKHRMTIKMNYQKAPYFEKYWNQIEQILSNKWDNLIDLNFVLIEYIKSELNLTTKTVKSSELIIDSTGSDKLLQICKRLGATTYISGELGKSYLDEKIFSDSGIKIMYEKFHHPIYKQIHGDFMPQMSIIDLLFNEGENAKQILVNSINL